MLSSEVAMTDAKKESEARCKEMLNQLIAVVKKQTLEIEDLAESMKELAVGLKAVVQPPGAIAHAWPLPVPAPTATLVTAVDHAVAAAAPRAETALAPESPTKCSTSGPDTNAGDLQVVAEFDPETGVPTVASALAEHSSAPSLKLFSTIKQDTLMPIRYSTNCPDCSIGALTSVRATAVPPTSSSTIATLEIGNTFIANTVDKNHRDTAAGIGTVASTNCLRECPGLVAGDISVTNLIIVGSATCIMGLQPKPPWPLPQGPETVLKLFHKQARVQSWLTMFHNAEMDILNSLVHRVILEALGPARKMEYCRASQLCQGFSLDSEDFKSIQNFIESQMDGTSSPLSSGSPSQGDCNSFISLDCGGADDYTDGIGIQWTSDAKFVFGGWTAKLLVQDQLQKQRIAIARAVIKNPAILLLDEATSALDSESEKLVQHALDQASMGRTTLVVAHKLSTVKNADQIAVVDGGTIAEIGTHDELINKGGPYSRLVKLQKMVSYIDQESDQFRASSVARTSTSCLSMSRASPMPLTPGVSKETDSSVSPPAPSFSRLLAMNAPEWRQAVIGSLSALVYGSLQPIYAITIGGMIAAFFVQDHNEMNAIISHYALIFCSLSVISIAVNLLQHYNFAYMGEHLVRRIRVQVLEKILTFEAAWFDEETNSSGALCSRLSNEASLVKTLVADRISLLLQTASGIIIAVTMGLVVAWKLALVMIAVQPSTMICYYAKKIVLSNVSRDLAKAQHQSTQIAIEAVYNHRMVTSFGCSSKVLQLFEHTQEEPLRKARKKSWVAGITTGLSPCLSFLSWALDFWYGGKLVQSGEISASDVFKTFFVLVSTGKLIADAGSMTSDLAKGANAVASVFEVLDRKSISPQNSQVEKDNQKNKIQGRIEFKKVDFAYPTRPQCLILQDFSLDVKAGTSIGLVGRSGCGKSTIIGLIQRFYDVDRGAARVDGMDVREMNILWYRGFTALVSQEPAIFSGSVRDNIAFGKPEADEDEIVEAAKAANAHEFISSLKDGYDTDSGEHGIQLSGGQKQRIAIARAIIRNPAILLLDEATSALDAQSEQVVQEALDRIMSGRTTIVVAHRLNTIKNVDSIAFLGEGKVVERGTYPQLMNKKGAFYNLATLQK